MRLQLLSAVGEATDSRYLMETGNVTFMVECGMFHGGREVEHYRNVIEMSFSCHRPLAILRWYAS